jgi:hypothetical protein
MQWKQACWNGGDSKKRCDHSQEDHYNEALKAFLQSTRMPKTLDIQKPNLRR